MTPYPMPSETFNRKVHQFGIHIVGISIGVAMALAELEHTPMPLVPRKGVSGRSNKIGRAITAGFAKLDRSDNHFKITDGGRAYVAALRKKGLL